MNLVIIRTSLQAVIFNHMIESGYVEGKIHLVLLFDGDTGSYARGIKYQCDKFIHLIVKRSLLDRKKYKLLYMFVFFLWHLGCAKIRKQKVYYASFSAMPFALALRFIPGLSIISFDDGTANVERRSTSYLSDQPTTKKGPAGWILRELFPKGNAYFVRGRIEKHWTIYPKLPNVVPTEKLVEVKIDWQSLIEEDDRTEFPSGVNNILLGTVNGTNEHITDDENRKRAIVWADLYLPHPRSHESGNLPKALQKYPAETIISYYATMNRINVAHYGSSTALSFIDDDTVCLIDLNQTTIG